MTLLELRDQIDKVDSELLHLLERRFALTQQTIQFKDRPLDTGREQTVLKQAIEVGAGKFRAEFIEKLFGVILAESRFQQQASQTSSTDRPHFSKPIGIIGYGRFGRLWGELLGEVGEVLIFDNIQTDHNSCSLKELIQRAGIVFFATPISQFNSALSEVLANLEGEPPLFADLLSVKCHPKKVFEKLLPPGARAILLHPMFGPDSCRSGAQLKIVVDRFSSKKEEAELLISVFKALGMMVVEMPAEKHDLLAAWSQGVTHYVGRILEELELAPSPIDTHGAELLFKIASQVCNDSWQLFSDLQSYNPNTLEMRVKLGTAQEKIYSRLIPDRVQPEKLVLGIQGGKGSFNEQAAKHYLEANKIQRSEIVYLYTTENVLSALHEGKIDRGQFAIHNSLGGIVHESIEAMSKYRFEIVEEYAIEIKHALMIHPECELSQITEIITHPQVLRQCAKNLAVKYPHLKLSSLSGELIDSARVAEGLAKGEVPRTAAVMGSAVFADIYGLKLIEENLQDAAYNLTSFLLVKRRIGY